MFLLKKKEEKRGWKLKNPRKGGNGRKPEGI